MQVMYQVNDVLGYYGGSPWDFEKIGELVYPWLDPDADGDTQVSRQAQGRTGAIWKDWAVCSRS